MRLASFVFALVIVALLATDAQARRHRPHGHVRGHCAGCCR
jgi:hypothetical protein